MRLMLDVVCRYVRTENESEILRWSSFSYLLYLVTSALQKSEELGVKISTLVLETTFREW